MSKRRIWIGGLLVAFCATIAVPPTSAKKGEPELVTVQHILIGYKRTVRGKTLDRSRKEARALAEKLFERAQAGEDFDALVKEYTDDSYPGILKLVNDGAPRAERAAPRRDMVPWFGDRSFQLEVGEVGIVKHHAGNSPFGWHIIKRLE